MENRQVFKEESFLIGCNYWASHAGIAMWSDWNADVVEKDFKKLSEEGIQVLRVFPLWPDFQPLTLLLGAEGNPVEYRHGEYPLSDEEAGKAGVSKAAIEHFSELTKLSQKYGLKLIVGLVTGWMSGRLFVPSAFERKNILTDPSAVLWQVRFVKYFVSYFKECPAIIAWDLGNECNCMARVPDRDSAWVWTSTIVNAIRAIDNTRPVLSGMHSLTPDGYWTMQDQGELTDILTTHPYPVFTPHCDQDPVNTIRSLLHATAESLFYSGIGGKPCLVEEIGTLGPMISNETIAADFVRTNLFSNWANGNIGLLWWCAYDQIHLENAPYDWFAVERELGLLKNDGTAKPVLKEMGRFGNFLKGLPFEKLPPRINDAVCILSKDQDQWGCAYSSFVLSKQAGFDMEFRYEDQPLPDAALYLLPCISGHKVISKRRYTELMEKVKHGAVLYISYNGGFLSQFEELTGLRVITREHRYKDYEMKIKMKGDELELKTAEGFRLSLEAVNAEILAVENDGNPIFTCASYGKGKVFFLGFPIELMLSTRPGVFHQKDAAAYWKIYDYIMQGVASKRVVSKSESMVGITEHPVSANSRIIIMINYSPEVRQLEFKLAEEWRIQEINYGSMPEFDGNSYFVTVEKNDAVIFNIIR